MLTWSKTDQSIFDIFRVKFWHEKNFQRTFKSCFLYKIILLSKHFVPNKKKKKKKSKILLVQGQPMLQMQRKRSTEFQIFFSALLLLYVDLLSPGKILLTKAVLFPKKHLWTFGTTWRINVNLKMEIKRTHICSIRNGPWKSLGYLMRHTG